MVELRIKDVCKEKGITQKELAEKLGLNYIAFNRNIKHNPTIGTLEKIADALNVPVQSLISSSNSVDAVCPKCGAKLSVTITESN